MARKIIDMIFPRGCAEQKKGASHIISLRKGKEPIPANKNYPSGFLIF